MRIYRLLTYTILVILILAACSNATPAPVTNTPLPSTATNMPKVTATAPTITPATSTPLPLTLNVEELVGFWRDVDGYIEFKPDGTWAFATTLNALKAGTLYVQGTFSIEGDELTILDDICGNKIGVYRLETKTEDKLTFTQVKEECIGQRRLPFLERIP
jgi:hypothetical protein